MKLILDEGMPLGAARLLREMGLAAHRVLEMQLGGAADEAILEQARNEAAVVATLDADFHQILAATGNGKPSVIRVRIEGLKSRQLADLLLSVVKGAAGELEAGAVVSVSQRNLRIRRLPLKSPSR